jgi:tripartite-type tricarboxylate transporter receptor subunit TctC
MLRFRRPSPICVAAATITMMLGGTVTSADAQVSFKDKSIRMIIGTPVGGGTDQNARLIAQFLAKHLPGEPTIVPQNMPGADGVVAMNYFVRQTQPDGLSFLAGFSTQVSPEVLQSAAAQYDPTTLVHFGGIAASGVVMVANKVAAGRLASRAEEPVVVAQVGKARVAAQMLLWGAEYLGWNLKWVSGYRGTAALTHALLNGEADLTQTGNIANLAPLMQTGNFTLVAQLGVFADGQLHRRSAFPDAPLFHDLIDDKIPASARSAFQAAEKITRLGKFYSLPNGTPTEIVQIYRKAFRDTVADPAFKALAVKQMDRDYVMITPEDVDQVIGDVMTISSSDLQFLELQRKRFGF